MEETFYPRYAEWDANHWWFRGRRAIVDAVLRSTLQPDSARRVLDFGCGPGAMLELLQAYGEVSGVDGSSEAVELCRQRGLTSVSQAEPGDPLPFEDGAFGLVTAFDVVEHIDDDRSAVLELRRVLEPNGMLVVTVPAFMALWGDQDVISHHRRRYRRRTLLPLLASTGFEVERSSYFNTLLLPPIAAVRLARLLVRRPDATRTDFDVTPRRLDRMLTLIMSAEAPMVARWGLPLGVSLLAVARAVNGHPRSTRG